MMLSWLSGMNHSFLMNLSGFWNFLSLSVLIFFGLDEIIFYDEIGRFFESDHFVFDQHPDVFVLWHFLGFGVALPFREFEITFFRVFRNRKHGVIHNFSGYAFPGRPS
jgi:hypothetical protein